MTTSNPAQPHAAPVPPTPRWVWWWGGVLLVLGLACLPLDGPVARLLAGHRVGGDIRLELGALQQFGQFSVTVLIAWVIWLVDPIRRRLLLDLLLAKLVLGIGMLVLKVLIGRARPEVGLPWLFAGPGGSVALEPGGEPVEAWTLRDGLVAELASMPSGHTAHAVLVAVILAAWYPRLRPVFVTLAVVVGVARVVLGAHYPSDVLCGAAFGLVIGGWIAYGHRGVRLFDAAWKRFVNRGATPAYPAMYARLNRGHECVLHASSSSHED